MTRSGEWGEYMWVRIKLNILKPLLVRQKKLTIENYWNRCASGSCMKDYWTIAFAMGKSAMDIENVVTRKATKTKKQREHSHMVTG